MKRNLLLTTFALFTTLCTQAQDKNIFLESSFWKTSPNVATVQAEIAKGNDPTQANSRLFDPVVMAIMSDAPTESIKLLLEQKGNPVNKQTHDSRIYLHWASSKGNLDIINYLIAKGSDVNLEDSHGSFPITAAVSAGQTNTAIYDAFFKAGVSPKKKYRNGANLLLLAIPNDKELILANYFSTKGMSLKDVDDNGNTAFNYAARSGDIAFMKTLLEKGVKYNDNALIIAAEGSRRDSNPIEVFQYLVEDVKLNPNAVSPEGQTVLHSLVRKPKQAAIINYFINKGTDINKADKEGNTALMNAAMSRDTEALTILLPKVKDINAQNQKGESALTVAVQSGTPASIELLLNKGANINVVDKNGNGLGYYLVQSYRPERGPANPSNENPFEAKAKLLQAKGLNLATPQKDGNTLYHFAVIKNDLSLLKNLEGFKIDVNAKNKDGLTALHKAAMTAKDDAIMKYLISIGAQKTIQTDFDESAYALAKENETLTQKNIVIDFLK